MCHTPPSLIKVPTVVADKGFWCQIDWHSGTLIHERRSWYALLALGLTEISATKKKKKKIPQTPPPTPASLRCEHCNHPTFIQPYECWIVDVRCAHTCDTKAKRAFFSRHLMINCVVFPTTDCRSVVSSPQDKRSGGNKILQSVQKRAEIIPMMWRLEKNDTKHGRWTEESGTA